MSEKKGWGETMLGWFVERDSAEKVQAPAEEAEPPRAEAPRPPPIELKGEVPLPEDAAELNFAAVYRAAGISEEAQSRVEKATTLLATLPAEASQEVKRQIVEASLKAFGYPVEEIVRATSSEIQSLQAFIEFSEQSTQKVVAQANERIEALGREIGEAKALIEHKLAAQQRLTRQCDQQKRRVQDVLSFFGPESVVTAASTKEPDPA